MRKQYGASTCRVGVAPRQGKIVWPSCIGYVCIDYASCNIKPHDSVNSLAISCADCALRCLQVAAKHDHTMNWQHERSHQNCSMQLHRNPMTGLHMLPQSCSAILCSLGTCTGLPCTTASLACGSTLTFFMFIMSIIMPPSTLKRLVCATLILIRVTARAPMLIKGRPAPLLSAGMADAKGSAKIRQLQQLQYSP